MLGRTGSCHDSECFPSGERIVSVQLNAAPSATCVYEAWRIDDHRLEGEHRGMFARRYDVADKLYFLLRFTQIWNPKNDERETKKPREHTSTQPGALVGPERSGRRCSLPIPYTFRYGQALLSKARMAGSGKPSIILRTLMFAPRSICRSPL